MKTLLLLACVLTLLTTTGCLIADHERHGHGHRHEGHGPVIGVAPVIIVPVR